MAPGLSLDSRPLAPTGSVGNMTGIAQALHDGSWDIVALQFVVESVGGAPTVTYKFQGSLDNTNWYDIGYITDASDTLALSAQTMVAAGASVCFISNPVARRYLWYRVVVTANNNVTYRADVYRLL